MKRCSTRHLGVGLVLCSALLMFPRSANAAVIVIGDGTPAACTASALKDALAAAAGPSPEYTIIRFDCGDEPLTISMPPGPRLVIPDRTTVDGGDRITIFGGEFLIQPENSVTILRLAFGWVSIRSYGTLEIRGSVFGRSGFPSFDNLGGTVRVSDTIFTQGVGPNGNLIYNQNGTLSIEHSLFEDNGGSQGRIESSGYLEIKNSIFRNNHGELAAISHFGDALIQNCEFTKNGGGRGGGVIFLGSLTATTTIKNSTFVGNGANHGSAIFNRGQLIIEGSEFYDNRATQTAGAIANFGSLLMVNSTVMRNSACLSLVDTCGGGIWTTTEPVLKHTTVADNLPDDVYVRP
jgi:Right handed beta helix region